MRIKNSLIMDNEVSSREIPKIEISYINRKELRELENKYEFIQYILKNTLKSIKEAIDKKWKKVELYNVINLSIIIELKRSNFPKVLDTICDFYQNEENYEMCAKIQKLKKKI